MGDNHEDSDPEELLQNVEPLPVEDADKAENIEELDSKSISTVETYLPQFYKQHDNDDKADSNEAPDDQTQENDEPQTPVRNAKGGQSADSDEANTSSNDDESLPSTTHSRQSSVQLQGLSPSPAGQTTPTRSPSGALHSMDQRFKTRLSSSPVAVNRSPTASPTKPSRHARTASQLSSTIDDLTGPETDSPWEAVRWTKLRKISNQLYSETAINQYGRPTSVLASAHIVVGTTRGLALVFDYHQNIKHVLGVKTQSTDYGEVTALAVSADYSYIAVGHSRGHITTWDLNKPNTPNLHISPISNDFIGQPSKEGHLSGVSVVHLDFSGKRHSALVSADVVGLVFSHDTVRTLLGRSVKSRKIMGKYPQNTLKKKPTSVLACAAAPLGSLVQASDDIGLVAVMTPYILAVVSTIPNSQTEYKVNRYKDVDLSMGLSACVAWFPALKGTSSDVPKLAYSWSNVLTILDVHSQRNIATESVDLRFSSERRYVGDEAIVSVQWISRHIIGLVTITQRLLILNVATMAVSEQLDLINKHVMHHDYFSRALSNLTVPHRGEDDQSLPMVVADAYFNNVKTFKGRIFLMGKYEFVVGSLSNWADRLLDIMDSGDYVRAIKLATTYYIGGEDLATIGLPADTTERHEVVQKNLPDMIFASLRYAFKEDAHTDPLLVKELADACISSIIAMDAQDALLSGMFDFYETSGYQREFFETLVPYIYDNEVNVLPPHVFKNLVLTYAENPSLVETLEELICSLDTKTLDLDLTLALCKKYNLRDTEIYVWNHAFDDFVTPLEDLIKIMEECESNEVNESEELAQDADRAYPYLSYVLTGRVYPTGLFMTDSVAEFRAKAHVYFYLFSGTRNAASDSYSSLTKLLSFNPSAFFAALNEAFEDGFLNDLEDSDVPSAVEQSDKVGFGKSMNRQFMVNSLLDVFSSKELGGKYKVFLNIFIARNYPKYSQFLILPGNVLSSVLEELCYNDEDYLKNDCELAVESLLTAYKPPDLDRLVSILYEVELYQVLQFVFRNEGRYTKLLEVTLKLYNCDNSTLNNYDLLNILEECFEKVSTSKDRVMIEDQVVESFETFVNINSDRFAEVVARRCPRLHEQVTGLAERPDLQYHYLRRLFYLVKQSGTMKMPSLELRHLYLSLLVKRGETELLRSVLTNILVNNEDVNLPAIVDDLMDIKAYDILALLLQRQERFSEAMIYIVDHLLYLDDVYSKSGSESVVTTEKELSRYVYIGVELCENAEDRVGKAEDDGKPIEHVESLGEQVWARLIDTLVDIARPKDGEDKNVGPQGEFRRKLLSQGLSALLDSTGRYVTNAQHNSTIIRIFKSVLAPQAAKSRTIGSVRPILHDLFAAYRYQHTMLSVARQLLDNETYEELLKLVSLRLRGWKVSKAGECEGCGRKVIGVGVDADWLYGQWERVEKIRLRDVRPKRKLSVKAMGKRPIDSDIEGVEGEILVVFNCTHTYHMTCLHNLGGRKKDLACILCEE